MPDLAKIEERAALEASPFFASLSQESRYLLLDLLSSFTDLWRWDKPDEADSDTIEALVAAATLELMVEAPGGSGDMQHIARIEGAAGAYVFENIPQDEYRHLQAVWKLRTNASATSDDVVFLINGDASAVYANAQYRLRVSGTTLAATAQTAESEAEIDFGAMGNNTAAGYFCYGKLNIYNYKDTTERAWDYVFTQFRTPPNTDVLFHQGGGRYAGGDPLGELEFQPVVGSTFVADSYIDLYGVKG